MNLTSFLRKSNKKPKTILRIIISVSVGLLVLWIFLVSKMDLPSQRESVLVKADTSQSIIEIRNNILGDNKSSNKTNSTIEAATKQEPIFQNPFTVFFVMITILGSIWLWSTKKKNNIVSYDQDIKDISQHVICQGVQLNVCEINEEIWVLGVTTNSIKLLHKYQKNEWNQSNISDSTPEQISSTDFNSMFKLFGN